MLVGAGATLAEALPSRPRLRPPLDATFFDLASRARLAGREVMKAYMEEHFGIDPFRGYTMESVFNYVYSDVFATPRPAGALNAYWALVQMYAAAIARTTNGLRGTTRQGVGSLLRTLWTLDADLTFITFNQDLVIEKAIEAASATATYSGIPWNVETCYGRDFVGFLYPRSGRMFSAGWDENDQPNPSLRIYKLHGSLNWVWRAATLDDARNSIPRPGTDIYCLTGQAIEGDLELDEEVQDKYLLPLVVPPIYEKGPSVPGLPSSCLGRSQEGSPCRGSTRCIRLLVSRRRLQRTKSSPRRVPSKYRPGRCRCGRHQSVRRVTPCRSTRSGLVRVVSRRTIFQGS